MASPVAQRPWPMPRGKTPAADLKLTYGKVLWISTGISVALHLILFVIWPSFAADASGRRKDRVIIELEQIPETRQERKPPPPVRPAVPIATDSPDVADDVTIETTELDMLELPPPPAFDFGQGEVELEEEEEFVEIDERGPVPIVKVEPVYPPMLRKNGIEGEVKVVIHVNEKGLVDSIGEITGSKLFREAARVAALQWEFKPAIQSYKPTPVWVEVPFKFTLR